MVSITNFSPSKNSPAGLKDDIKFEIGDLRGTDGSINLPDTSFIALTDIAAQEAGAKDAIVYINVGSATSDTIVLDSLSLTVATHQQIVDETQRISPIRQQVRASPSSFMILRFGNNTILSPSDKQSINQLAPSLTQATKGNILDEFSSWSSFVGLPATLTSFISTSTTKFSKVIKAVDTQTIEVSDTTLFGANGVVSIVNPRYQQEAFKSGFNLNSSPRDVVYLKVKSVDIVKSTVTFFPTGLSPSLGTTSDGNNILFSTKEMDSFSLGSVLAIPGTPVLFDQKADPTAFSLKEAETIVESEIPLTRIYAPKTAQPDGKATFIGNLDRTSLSVIMYDDDQEILLVKEGDAQAGVGVDYRLVTDKSAPNYGSVQVAVSLKSSPASIPISGVATIGATAVQLSVRIVSTPNQIADNSSDKTPPAPGEFYFNFQIKLPDGRLINLNKYGTIRVFDTITFLSAPRSQNGQVLGTAIVHGVEVSSSLIVLDKPLQVNLSNKTIIEIPQAPLNPGRKYRITVSCQDKEGPTPTPTSPVPAPATDSTGVILTNEPALPPVAAGTISITT